MSSKTITCTSAVTKQALADAESQIEKEFRITKTTTIETGSQHSVIGTGKKEREAMCAVRESLPGNFTYTITRHVLIPPLNMDLFVQKNNPNEARRTVQECIHAPAETFSTIANAHSTITVTLHRRGRRGFFGLWSSPAVYHVNVARPYIVMIDYIANEALVVLETTNDPESVIDDSPVYEPPSDTDYGGPGDYGPSPGYCGMGGP